MTGTADPALSLHFGRAQHVQATLPPPATCERRALDGVAGFGEAMKGDGVKWLRKEEIAGRDKGCEAEGGFIGVCALWNTSVPAMARGLRFILQAP